jgi:hypothetical protein
MERAPAPSDPVHQFLAEPGDDLLAVPVIKRQEQGDQTSSGQSAEAAVTFDEQRVGAPTGGGDGRSRSGRPTADDEDLGPGAHRRPPGGFVDEFHQWGWS